MKLPLAIALCVSFAGCAMSPKPAIVNDMGVPKEVDTGYRVTAVDGRTVKRASNKNKTAVPVALIESGKHTLTIQSPTSNEPVKLEATLEPFKEYRIAKKADGSPTLVEFTKFPAPETP